MISRLGITQIVVLLGLGEVSFRSLETLNGLSLLDTVGYSTSLTIAVDNVPAFSQLRVLFGVQAPTSFAVEHPAYVFT